MSKLTGYTRNDFTTKDGKPITGYTIYISEPATGDGAGMVSERYYLSDAKLEREQIALSKLLGQSVRVLYNRYGKVESITAEKE